MNRRFFPRRLFTHFVFSIGGLLAGVLFGALFLTWVLGAWMMSLSFVSAWVTFSIFFILIGSVGVFLLSWRLAKPVGRVIAKAMALSSKKQARMLQLDEEIFDEEAGEYFELEQALDKISRKLLKRRMQLAHEREEAQALMSYMNDGVVSVDRNEKLMYFNSYFGAQFLDPVQLKEKSEGGSIQFSHVFRDPQLVEGVRKALEQGQTSQFQKKMPTKIEPLGRHYSITITALREDKGGQVIYGVLLLFHDITDLKKTELMRTEFVENASHELRTPLTSLKGYVATAMEDVKEGRTEQLPQFLSVISGNVQRLSELVNDLLTLSTLEHKANLKFEYIDPAEITNSVIQQITPAASERRIMIKAHFDSSEFRGDPSLVERVMLNLVGNAVKYIQEGGTIELRWVDDRANKGVQFSVKDNGPGIGEEHLNRLFERFYRIDKGRSRDIGGTGLGLAIVKHIMQSHGGHCGVRSIVGQGTEFICFFPRGI